MTTKQDTIHNCFVDLISEVEPTIENIEAIAKKLPNDIIAMGTYWGWGDTEVRGMVYRWIDKNVRTFKDKICFIVNPDGRGINMKEHLLNKKESLTVMEMLQDCIERGMISNHYVADKIEEIIDNSTDSLDFFKKDFEIIIRVKDKE